MKNMPHPYRPRSTYIQLYRCTVCGLDEGHNRCRLKPAEVNPPTCSACWTEKRQANKMRPITAADFVDGMTETRSIGWICPGCRQLNSVAEGEALVCFNCGLQKLLEVKK